MDGDLTRGRGPLVRSTDERMLAGVCGGIADWLNMDPLHVRILWVVLSLFPGPMWVLYVALWIILPERPTGRW